MDPMSSGGGRGAKGAEQPYAWVRNGDLGGSWREGFGRRAGCRFGMARYTMSKSDRRWPHWPASDTRLLGSGREDSI
jgi:hypothetical protein